MIQQSANFITVPEVGLAEGYEPENKANWAIGKQTQKRYTSVTLGALPLKDNRPKIRGSGENCKALYHEHWREPIAAFFRKRKMEEARQPDLFKDKEPGGLYVPEWLAEKEEDPDLEIERLRLLLEEARDQIEALAKERDELREAEGRGVNVDLKLEGNGNGDGVDVDIVA